jgi:hypothetical protein
MSEESKPGRKIALHVRITDSHGKTRIYRARPLGQAELTDCVSRAIRITRKAEEGEQGDRAGNIVYLVAELAMGHVQCSCPGYCDWGHCKHQEGLIAIGLFQPALTQRVFQLEQQLAAAVREIEERSQAPYSPEEGKQVVQRIESHLVSVGERLHYVNPRTQQPEEVEIVKVGRDKARVRRSNGRTTSVCISNLVPF